MNPHFQPIAQMAIDRVKPKAIAAKLDIPVTLVHDQIKRARKLGMNIPHFRGGRSAGDVQSASPLNPSITVPSRLHSMLKAEAERAGKSPTEVAQSILEAGLLQRWSRHG